MHGLPVGAGVDDAGVGFDAIGGVTTGWLALADTGAPLSGRLPAAGADGVAGLGVVAGASAVAGAAALPAHAAVLLATNVNTRSLG